MIGAGDRLVLRLAVIAAGTLTCSAATAGAWPMAPGETQTILKFEDQRASSGYGLGGVGVPIPDRREDGLSLFFEHGLTDRFTLQGKVGLVDGVDGPIRYRGRGPLELGVRTLLWRRRGAVASLYVGGVVSGAGLNAVWAGPGAGRGDVEVRFLAGNAGKFFGRHAYSELQVVRLQRRKLDNELRVETTSAVDVAPRWRVMVQSYAGRAYHDGPDARWFKGEASLMRDMGAWSLQAGWRQSLAGREASKDHGPVVALWTRF